MSKPGKCRSWPRRVIIDNQLNVHVLPSLFSTTCTVHLARSFRFLFIRHSHATKQNRKKSIPRISDPTPFLAETCAFGCLLRSEIVEPEKFHWTLGVSRRFVVTPAVNGTRKKKGRKKKKEKKENKPPKSTLLFPIPVVAWKV